MSLNHILPDGERNNCENDSCNSTGKPVFYCVDCDATICEACWKTVFPHRPGKLGRDRMPHEQTNYYIAKRFDTILHPPDSPDTLQRMHEEDELSTWFGVITKTKNEYALRAHSTYTDLMAQSQQSGQTTKFPHLVSFIGQTSAGKSTLVKMLIASRECHLGRDATARFPSPVVGSPKNDQTPTSADVHLYADPATFFQVEPMLYADCEGLDAGEETPIGAEGKRTARVEDAKRLMRKVTHRFSSTRERKIEWANTEEKCTRQFAVTELYPRLLYTFSDVVVFVLRNAKTFRCAVLQKLLDWGSASLEKSVGQPILPHAIIAVNATDILVDGKEWDVEHATALLLDSVKNSLEKVPEFRKLAQTWRDRRRKIDKVLDLILCYYSSFSVVRIPVKGRYGLMDKQVTKLHERIIQQCKDSYDTKRSVGMLSNAEELDVYVQAGFDHFSRRLDKPFNFMEVAIRNNPIPDDFGGHIVQLAILMLPQFSKDAQGARDLFSKLSRIVASCIFLNCVLKLKGLATVLFKSYQEPVNSALADFCALHWPCEFKNAKGRCVNVNSRHTPKGHQSEDGRIIETGPYRSTFFYEGYEATWIENLISNILELEKKYLESIGSDRRTPEKDIAFELHKGCISKFYLSLGSAKKYISHATCLSCLMGIPEYALPCGHVLCLQCAMSSGQEHESNVLTFEKCPLHPNEVLSKTPWSIHLKPPFAGVRILSLDGGGIRGIVELETLRAIQESLGGKIPVTKFFDLIVGTSTGGIIALALGVKNLSVDKCISHFVKLCDQAFTPRELHKVPGLQKVSALHHGSSYKTQPLHNALQEEFGSEFLFGGPRKSDSTSSTKVAVTATDEAGKKAIIFANYHHSSSNNPSYESYQPSNPELEMKVWEAAAATSAAPSYFKPFYHEVAGRCYLDGALYNNNPVRVAHRERRILWPDVLSKDPDIFLSIGTGQSEKSKNDDAEFERKQKPTHQGSRVGRWRRVFSVMLRRIDSILNAETAWKEFCDTVSESSSEDAVKQRYIRMNPDLGDYVPRLDEKKRLQKLQKDTKNILQSPPIRADIDRIAFSLVASLFYYERKTPPRRGDGLDEFISCSGAIRCRFVECLEEESKYIPALGEFFRQQMEYQPYFEIKEDENSEVTREVKITSEAIDKMIKDAIFSIGECNLRAPSRNSSVSIVLWLKGKKSQPMSYPISGFPRKIMAEEILKVPKPRSTGLRRRKSFPPTLNSSGHSGRTQTYPFISWRPTHNFDREPTDSMEQLEDEGYQPTSVGAIHHSSQTSPTRIEPSSLRRSSSLPRSPNLGSRNRRPDDHDPKFQREFEFTKRSRSNSHGQSPSEVGMREHLILPLDNVEDELIDGLGVVILDKDGAEDRREVE